MKFYPTHQRRKLSKEVYNFLKEIRKIRGFNQENYLQAKSAIIVDYFKKSKLDSCVVAVSGGVDSALSLALMNYCQTKYPEIIKKIVPITLPLLNEGGASNQELTIQKAKELCDKFNLDLVVGELNNSFVSIYNQIENGIGKANEWARGQLVAYSRTPFVYYTTSVLSAQGFKSVVIGTINRDEGAYLGYVGKASDGIVDLQIISDLHKSEVFSMAKHLAVPNSILESVPAGDMYDGRVDEDVFGAPYDFVELYINFLNLNNEQKQYFLNKLSKESLEEFDILKNNIEELHNFNSHKYNVGSVAIHLDVMESAVNGGWIEGVHSGRYKNKPKDLFISSSKFTGFTENSPQLIVEDTKIKQLENKEIPTLKIVNNFLSEKNILNIKKYINLNSSSFVKTDIYGQNKNVDGGSKRISFYDKIFADNLLFKIKQCGLADIIKTKDIKHCFTNYGEGSVFKLKEVNPMFRVLKYEENSELVPHYDDSFNKNEQERSLVTLLIGVSCAENGGITEFILNAQDFDSYENRNFNDLDSLVKDVDLSYQIKSGDLVLFDHRIQHQSNKIISGEKVVIRSELIYERCC